MGQYAVEQAATENFVAVCDVDDARAAEAYDAHPKVPRVKDFRVMLDKMDKDIEEAAMREAKKVFPFEFLNRFDDIITYFEYETSGAGTCDRVMEMTPDGSTREVFKLRDHFSHRVQNGEWCHTNAINYIEDEDALAEANGVLDELNTTKSGSNVFNSSSVGLINIFFTK